MSGLAGSISGQLQGPRAAIFKSSAGNTRYGTDSRVQTPIFRKAQGRCLCGICIPKHDINVCPRHEKWEEEDYATMAHTYSWTLPCPGDLRLPGMYQLLS
jgi:hypothetical protein